VIGRQASRKTRELFTQGLDPQTAGSKMEKIRKDAEEQILRVLSDDQKASLEKMKGQKLEIPDSELRGRGPGGFRGFGGPGPSSGSEGHGKRGPDDKRGPDGR